MYKFELALTMLDMNPTTEQAQQLWLIVDKYLASIA